MEAEPLIYPTAWGEDRVWDVSRWPHAVVLGGAGSARRDCVRALAADAAGCGLQVVVLAPGSAGGEWPAGLRVLSAPEAMVEELEQASAQMWDAYSHLLVCPLGWAGPRSLVVVDGVAGCLDRIRVVSDAAARAARETLAALMLGRRAAGFHLVVAAEGESELVSAGLGDAHLAERLSWHGDAEHAGAAADLDECHENATTSSWVGKPAGALWTTTGGGRLTGLRFR